MDQNRDGFIDKNDLRDTFAALGKLSSLFLLVILQKRPHIDSLRSIFIKQLLHPDLPAGFLQSKVVST